jgi:hypothetical protein
MSRESGKDRKIPLMKECSIKIDYSQYSDDKEYEYQQRKLRENKKES